MNKKKFKPILFLGLANLSLIVTILSVNTSCSFFTHQPKMPEKAKKLRKF